MSKWLKPVVYVVVPACVGGLLVWMYFSGNIVLQRIVSPKLPPLPLGSWREFGLLENLQHVLLLVLAGVAAIGALRQQELRLRMAFAGVVLFTLFVFLEEIDYGTHYLKYLASEHDFDWFQPATEWPPSLLAEIDMTAEPFNLHNRGDLTDILKFVSTTLLLVLFVALPLARVKLQRPWLPYLAPSAWGMATLLVMLLLSTITHAVAEHQEAAVRAALAEGLPAAEIGSINQNLSEFRELLLYYLFLVYVVDIGLFRTALSRQTGPATEYPANAVEEAAG